MPPQIPIKLSSPRNQVAQPEPQDLPIDRIFPVASANKLATLESFNKHLYRPNSYLHKWWARRSGTTFRFILKQLILDSGKRDYYEPGGLEGQVIFDPMMGSGTTLHEAIRMGANVVGVDIDPIPSLQVKASLTVSSLAHKKAVFSRFLTALRRKLTPFFQTQCPHCDKKTEIQFVLYALRRKCVCGEALFVDDLLLRQDNHHDLSLCPHCHSIYSGSGHKCKHKADRALIVKGTRRCEKCESDFVDIINEPFPHRYIPLVVVGACPKHGQFFKDVDQEALLLLDQARLQAELLAFGDEDGFRVPHGPKSDDLHRRGITTFRDLFTPRQSLYLNACLELLPEVPNEDRLWVALLVSTSLEFNSLLCGYKGGDIRRPGAIRHVFSHHAYSFPYTALENNPAFSGNTSGTLTRLFHDRVLRAGQWALAPVEVRLTNSTRSKVLISEELDGGQSVTDWKSLSEGERKFLVLQADSATLAIPDAIADYVITDPPYYDSVQYSDLSNFFRVWLRLFLPHEVDWLYDSNASAVSEGGVIGGRKYGAVLGNIWKTCFRALKKDQGRLIFTFHHWRHDAWAELTLSLKNAGFLLVNRYVVFSENPISVHIMGLNALKHDAILVLRPDAGNGVFRKWMKPSRVDATDSYSFCHDCGNVLGWFLNSELNEDQIRSEWKRLLGDNGNGKASR